MTLALGDPAYRRTRAATFSNEPQRADASAMAWAGASCERCRARSAAQQTGSTVINEPCPPCGTMAANLPREMCQLKDREACCRKDKKARSLFGKAWPGLPRFGFGGAFGRVRPGVFVLRLVPSSCGLPSSGSALGPWSNALVLRSFSHQLFAVASCDAGDLDLSS